MLRYLRRLADRDLALDRTMIPLGSCTMKLNATAEMEPITWPEFGPHPSVRAARPGRRATCELIDDLERWLAEITGYDAVSLQPNAGSQGEYAGLLAIRTLPRVARRGRARRVPHPRVGARHERGVGGDGRHARRRGRVRRPRQRRPRRPRRRRPTSTPTQLAALMVTYPSTHGVFEEQHRRDLRGRARARRPGVPRRREPQRARRRRASRASSAPTCRTSTCTRRSASRTAAAVRASGRSACARTSRRSCRTTRCSPRPGPRRASARSARRRGARPASCRSRGRTSR